MSGFWLLSLHFVGADLAVSKPPEAKLPDAMMIDIVPPPETPRFEGTPAESTTSGTPTPVNSASANGAAQPLPPKPPAQAAQQPQRPNPQPDARQTAAQPEKQAARPRRRPAPDGTVRGGTASSGSFPDRSARHGKIRDGGRIDLRPAAFTAAAARGHTGSAERQRDLRAARVVRRAVWRRYRSPGHRLSPGRAKLRHRVP